VKDAPAGYTIETLKVQRSGINLFKSSTFGTWILERTDLVPYLIFVKIGKETPKLGVVNIMIFDLGIGSAS